MSSPRLVHWSGLASMLGGLLWALWPVGAAAVGFGEPLSGERKAYETYNRLVMPTIVSLLVVGLIGLHVAQRGIYGRLGSAGFTAAAIGLALMLAGNVVEFWLYTPYTDAPSTLRNTGWGTFLLGFGILYVGSALLGLATMRAKMLPSGGALLLTISLPVGIATLFLLKAAGFGARGGLTLIMLLYGAGWVLLGYSLRSGAIDRAKLLKQTM